MTAEARLAAMPANPSVGVRPAISGWHPPVGQYRGRVKSIYLDEDDVNVEVIFCEDGVFRGVSRFALSRDTQLFSTFFVDALGVAGFPVPMRDGHFWEFTYMKITIVMTHDDDESVPHLSHLASIKLVPWPSWWDNRPVSAKRKKRAA